MLFNSLHFLIFFPIVVGIYYLIPCKFRTYWLLAASYYFYMCWNAKYAVLILFSTVITYLSGIVIEKVKRSGLEEGSCRRRKKLCVAVSFVLNLSVLFFFKYMNFGIDTLNQILTRFHIILNMPEFDILLPVGISFYTFQALGYTVDVYRDEIYAERNFLRYALFVSFFPQLVAGPIERSINLLKQLATYHKPSFNQFREGILLMLWGYFLKVVLADRIAIFVDTVFPYTPPYTGSPLLAALYYGVCLGAGLAIFYMRGTSSGGVDFLTLSIRAKKPHLSMGKLMMAIDFLIVSLGWPVFGNIDSILYGLVATFVTSAVVDKIMYGMGAGTLAVVVTNRSAEVAERISRIIDRGSTVLEGVGSYTGEHRDILLCACSNSQSYMVKNSVLEVDPAAFVMMTETSQVFGEGFLR